MEQTVSETVRATVGAAADLTIAGGETTVVQIAARLRIDKTSASRRVRTALDLGYLKNLEDRRGRPSRLAIGDELPADVTILPTVEDLARLHGCSGNGGDGVPNDIVYPPTALDPHDGTDDAQADRWLAASLPASDAGGAP